ncbi:MAG: type II secretion system protein [Elusimicrobiaceae bacterium]|nr:type II secretion system protein [Elusimicrobiaceae bacterium]
MFSKKGFTLTEMLFVVVIAAGILALAMPSYKRARDRSRHQAATGMLMDLGNAVEAITRDLEMQGRNVTVGANGLVEYPVSNVTIDPDNGRGTIREIYDAASDKNAAVLGMLLPFKYLDSFSNPGGYVYYVGNGGDCAQNSTVNPLLGTTVVACMLKPSSTTDDCFKGARYYQGGRLQTLRGNDCHN